MSLEQPAEMQDSATTGAAPQVSEPEVPDNTDDDLSPELLEDDEQPTDDELEDELEGVKGKGKKDALEKLKAERLMQADYTRKTQEVAEQRKAIEAQRAQVQQQQQFAQAFVEEIAAAKAIDMRLQQYGQINWAELEQADPSQAMRLQRERMELQAAKAQLGHSITQKHQAQALGQQQELARLAQEGEAVLSREIKGWGQETKAKLHQFALSQGFDEAALANIYDPRLVKLLHDAMTLHSLRAKAQQKPKPEAQPAPVTRINGGKSTQAHTGPDDRQSMDEWLKARQAQLKRK